MSVSRYHEKELALHFFAVGVGAGLRVGLNFFSGVGAGLTVGFNLFLLLQVINQVKGEIRNKVIWSFIRTNEQINEQMNVPVGNCQNLTVAIAQ